MTFWQCFPVLLLSINSMFLAWQIRKITSRVIDLEHALRMRDWIDALNSGESLSDMAYMKEKDFLK